MTELVQSLKGNGPYTPAMGRAAMRLGRTATVALLIMLAAALINAVGDALRANPDLARGVSASTLAGLATGIGALAILFLRGLTRRGHDALLGFSAGVMLAATVFSLLLPALDSARALTGSASGAGLLAATGMILGALALWAMDRLLPHAHFIKPPATVTPGQAHGAWLIVAALSLHNLPEGLAVGAGFAGSSATGLTTALGIGIQNMPEGLVVAAAMASLGYGLTKAIGVALLTGLVEPVGALLGGMVAGTGPLLLPLSLAFAAGAMLFVVSHEMVPESHRSGNEGAATGALMAGFAGMLALAGALG